MREFAKKFLGRLVFLHFTIDENDPEDHEVGIDPEMLGHIFENLLEDNKDKGAFYTPKAIVQYTARKSLRHYLDHAIGFERDRIEGLLDQQLKMLAGKIARTRSWTKAKGEPLVETYRAELAALEQKATKLRDLQQSSERPFFLWHLYFQKVFENGGFDIVLANPPYVRQETIREYKPLLKREGYKCFTGTADLFVYFYEQAVNLLRPGGTLTFITSNKYYRAGYGENLRPYLTSNLTLHTLIDFGDAPVFDAIAYASILIGTKAESTAGHSLRAHTWRVSDSISRIPQTIDKDGIDLAQADLADDGWRLENPASIRLLEKLRNTGTPLGEYVGGKFYYGIKTGFNEAFVITREQRDQLIAEDPKSEEILRPYLRGRDVKRWCPFPQDLWLIFARRGIRITNYPAVLKHLKKYRSSLEPQPASWVSGEKWAGRKKGTYKWYELQDAVDYWKFFDTPKIIMGRFMNKAEYCFDDEGHYHNDALYIIGEATRDLGAFLNSQASWWFLSQISTDLQNGYIQALIQNQRQIPIPPASPEDQTRLATLAERAAGFAKSGDADALRATEREIDGIVYRLFSLTPAEIALIEEALA